MKASNPVNRCLKAKLGWRELACVLVLVLVACGTPSPDQLVASAREALAKNNPKAAVVHLSKCLADEYLRRSVRVNCVAPGGIETPLQSAFMCSTQ